MREPRDFWARNFSHMPVSCQDQHDCWKAREQRSGDKTTTTNIPIVFVGRHEEGLGCAALETVGPPGSRLMRSSLFGEKEVFVVTGYASSKRRVRWAWQGLQLTKATGVHKARSRRRFWRGDRSCSSPHLCPRTPRKTAIQRSPLIYPHRGDLFPIIIDPTTREKWMEHKEVLFFAMYVQQV